MIRTLLALALLAPSLVHAMPHVVAGLTDGTKTVLVDGDSVGSVLVTNGAGSFESSLRGQYEIVPVVLIPPVDCPDLVAINVTADAQCCGAAVPWKCILSARNDGRAAATAFRIRVTLQQPGGTPSIKCEYDVASLAIGATAGPFSCTLSSTVPSVPVGDWAVVVWVDNTALICEPNEVNNKVTL